MNVIKVFKYKYKYFCTSLKCLYLSHSKKLKIELLSDKFYRLSNSYVVAHTYGTNLVGPYASISHKLLIIVKYSVYSVEEEEELLVNMQS